MKEPLGRVLKLWVLNLKINTNLQNIIPKEDSVIVSRKLQIICKKGNQNNKPNKFILMLQTFSLLVSDEWKHLNKNRGNPKSRDILVFLKTS